MIRRQPPRPRHPRVVHCTMTIGEARAQYMDRVRQMREEQFREAQADAAYNHHLL